ncbi:tol-pal system YbgF family protein [Actinokineospora soli]|uniref:Tol-pal system YbgF family protein n=1 Tax=Actinokineospora soli TaxID=1048753 RepID=A0ABW2TGK2_9PSEU
MSALRRRPDELAYLLARTAPEELTDEQVADLGFTDEAVRRAYARGDVEAVEQAPHCVLRSHLLAMSAIAHNRPSDVQLADVLPEHRDTARGLVDGLVEAQNGEPTGSLLRSRVIDDPTTWQPLVNLLGTETLMRDGDGRIPNRAFADWLALTAARERLFVADWVGAVGAARRCLDLATSEHVRDEAHNLLACALHNSGKREEALRELETAIEGDYSVALLANIGVVAAELDREVAAQHLARVVREAPTTRMRVNAAIRSLAMWQTDNTKVWAGEDLAAKKLPSALRDPLRAVITQDIAEDEFRLIANVLARLDAEWMRTPGSLTGSPTGSRWPPSSTARSPARRCTRRCSACSPVSRTGSRRPCGCATSGTRWSSRPRRSCSTTSTTRTTPPG